MKKIVFTVTNDLTYDQRMHRICNSLATAGYIVTLVGRSMPASLPLQNLNYRQKRLGCFFTTGFAFYAEYNLRLFFYLLTHKTDCICTIDLDTILPGLFVSAIKKTKRVYDAHEYFTELKEIRTRPFVKKCWTFIEKFAVPKFYAGYTVSEGLAQAFKTAYDRNYAVVRNLPVLLPQTDNRAREKFIVFQGAVNEARGFEVLIPAMKFVNHPLVICGDGNFMVQLKKLIRDNGVENKVELRGMMVPAQLRLVAGKAALGIGLAEREGINQLHALPNKFLDYMHAELPQLTMNFPEYKKVNERYKIAVLIDELTVNNVAKAINQTMADAVLLKEMSQNAALAKQHFCWQQEEKVLLNFYKHLFS